MGHLPVPLDAVGCRQSRVLARFLKKIPICACYSSPAVRALETAKIILNGRRIPLVNSPEVIEIDYGEWVGKRFDEVTKEPAYRLYHSTPKKSRPPSGESMREVHRRSVGFIERLRRRHHKGRVVVVTHADVIKTLLVHYLGLDLNQLQCFRIDNGSVSLLWFYQDVCRVLTVNHLGALDRLFVSVQIPKWVKRWVKKRRPSKN